MGMRAVARLGVICIAAAIVSLAGGCATDKAVVAQANQVDGSLHPAVIASPSVNGYLQQITDRVVTAAKELDAEHRGPKSHFDKKQGQKWMFEGEQIHLVNSKTLNAFTTGGNHIYVYNELFQLCQNEQELAAVIAHEFGHVYSRHVQKGMNRQYAMLAAAAAAGGAGYVAGGKEHGAEYAGMGAGAGLAAGQFVNMGFGREDEAEADEWGFQFYTRAGWDPRHFGDFFQRMIDKGYDKTPAMLSDHPTLASRVKAAQKRASQFQQRGKIDQWRRTDLPIASPQQFARYKQEANQASVGMPDDKKVLATQNLLQALPRTCWIPYEPEDQRQAIQSLVDQANQSNAQQANGK